MLIFDFDGVIVNSVDEAAVTAFNALHGLTITTLSQLPPGYLELFRRNRFHLQPAGDFPAFAAWCEMQALQDPSRLLDAAEFSTWLSKNQKNRVLQTALFFEARVRFQTADWNTWISLNSIYEPLFGTLKEYQERASIVILTNKNRAAVTELCGHFGLQLDSENIYAGDGGKGKTENLFEISDRFKITSCQFIDDSIKNLLEIQVSARPFVKLNPLHALWGYVGPEDAKIAEQHAVPQIRIEDAVTLFRNSLAENLGAS